LKELDSRSGEVKSMRTVKAYRRRGVASKILEHIIKEAQQRAYDCLNLETGAMTEFTAARALYIRYGFEYRSIWIDTQFFQLFSQPFRFLFTFLNRLS
jgi:putative acetyltransferase